MAAAVVVSKIISRNSTAAALAVNGSLVVLHGRAVRMRSAELNSLINVSTSETVQTGCDSGFDYNVGRDRRTTQS